VIKTRHASVKVEHKGQLYVAYHVGDGIYRLVMLPADSDVRFAADNARKGIGTFICRYIRQPTVTEIKDCAEWLLELGETI